MVHQLRKSYSLTDLGHDESDFGPSDRRALITSDQDEIAALEMHRRTGSASRAAPVRYVRHISRDPDPVSRSRSARSRDSPSPSMAHYRGLMHDPRPGPPPDSYPIISTTSRTLPRPRPKSLVMDQDEVIRLRKYKSVVTLEPSYQRNFVPRHSPAKSTSPTHEAVLRRRLSSLGAAPPLHSSEYFSMSHSSESDA